MLLNKFDEMFAYIIAEVGGKCSPVLMRQALYKASREFCLRSQAWVEDSTAIDLVADQKEYAVTIKYDARIDRIITVRQNTQAGVDAGNKGEILLPTQYTFEPNESGGTLTLKVAPASAVTSGLVVRVSFVPQMGHKSTPGKHTLPQWFMNRYGEAIYGRALADLQTMPKRDWSDLGRAKQNMILFNRGLQNARRDLLSAYGERKPTALKDY